MKSRGMKTRRIVVGILLLAMALGGCGKSEARDLDGEPITVSEDTSYIDVAKLREGNSDIFAWLNVPGTNIACPVLQSSEGDDSFYTNHNFLKNVDVNGAVYIEAANLQDMCDFNTVVHGSSYTEDAPFDQLDRYLDKAFFDENEYIYVYLDGNALAYYIFAAYLRDNERLVEQYDFSYASGCQDFIDEIFESRSMSKLVREGWEGQVKPENFLITLTTTNAETGKQLVVVGTLIGDVAGTIDRYVDYGDPEEY